ncbi:hypothetical protein C8N43_0750 [Litoreibacter ponti]|uniref:T4 bacteriophage base plate protein n=1 Tax=Litoreibacter ponti TaxID=1510457 RepID=A0A2T6BJ61_9RHOB|nr:hypothetical protein [Litoreibacter ponti]PTX56099.1 hypothetical protein C8N43_0750 [Litoreibacter ponti]
MSERAPLTLAVAFPTAVPRPLTGRVELALAEAMQARTRPAQVTGVIEAMFFQIGGLSVTRDLVTRLATGARAWLLARAALTFLPGPRWFQARCGSCGESYDLRVSLSELPRSDVPSVFPVIEVDTSRGPRRFEVPSGAVEDALAHATPDQALRVLARECGLADTRAEDAQGFTTADLQLIDAQLDAATPDIAETIETACPICEAETAARIDPLSFAFPSGSTVLGQVHRLARSYHWSEDAILDLPTARRASYARLIANEARR